MFESGVWVFGGGETVDSGEGLFNGDGEGEFGDGSGVIGGDFDSTAGVLHLG